VESPESLRGTSTPGAAGVIALAQEMACLELDLKTVARHCQHSAEVTI
jgi:hypothetical protein